MPGALGRLILRLEATFDRSKARLGKRLGRADPLMIQAYRGMGTRQKVYLKGRVLEDEAIRPAHEGDTRWDNLVNMIRRFESDEIPHARVRVRLGQVEVEAVADEEGFFEVWIEPAEPLPEGRLWQPVELELVSPLRPGQPPVRAQGEALIPPPSARFGVVSDIDDTVVHTDATRPLRMARNIFLSNARTRQPYPGAAAFYQALHRGVGGQEGNPLFYVSSSPWNLYDLLSEFFQLHEIPVGPVLFLRDYGLSAEELFPRGHRAHKLGAIRRILDLYPHLPFLLVGDSGQDDPEIYLELAGLYPGRIPAIYIRQAGGRRGRLSAIQRLAGRARALGSALVVAQDSQAMAAHAAAQGWIAPAAALEIPPVETGPQV